MSNILYALFILVNCIFVLFAFRGVKFCIYALSIELGSFFAVLVLTSSMTVLALIVNHGWILIVGVAVAILAYKMSKMS